MGRAGRRGDLSLAVLVGTSAALDQFIVTHPEYLFGHPMEEARTNPDNLLILTSHLKCAAFELPLRDGETFGPSTLPEILPVEAVHVVLLAQVEVDRVLVDERGRGGEVHLTDHPRAGIG